MKLHRVQTAGRVIVACVVLSGLLPAPAAAQGQGRIGGRVVEARSQRPLAGAQVFVDGTGIGTLTNANGNYLLLNVPAGEVTVRVQMIGWTQAEQTVRVVAGQAASADFELEQTVISLDAVVVTGAGVQTERRKLGNTIATIGAQSLETAPVQSVSEILQGREPGVVGLPSGGLTGEGAKIRIRGAASLSQSNEPIVYVDGVRVDNAGGFAGVSAGGFGNPSRLDDINPEAIERVEILKGAAAATLYGTEASNGVIQIFTKKGTAGEPTWTFKMEQGFLTYPADRYKPNAGFARTPEQAEYLSRLYGMDIRPYEVFERTFAADLFETGYASSYALSLSGGGSNLTYFVSGRYQREDGPLGAEDLGPARDNDSRKQVTFSMDVTPTEKLTVGVSGTYSETYHEVPAAGNVITAPMSVALYSKPERAVCFSEVAGDGRCTGPGNPTGAPTFATVRETMQQQVVDDVSRFYGSLRTGYQLLPSVRLEGTFGVDVVDQRSSDFSPFGWNVDGITPFDTLGTRSVGARRHKEISVDLKASWNTYFTDAISSTFVLGTQGFFSETEESGGTGRVFPGPGIGVAGGGAVRDMYESFLSVVNAGVFFQEQLGFDDFIFATIGARYDKNSAFGESSSGALYPKFSISVVPSDRDGWSLDWLSTLRLRAAIGQSGLQPGAFDKFTTFSSLSTPGGAGLQPENLGNPDLKPEVSTEWEAGAEAGLLDDRLGVEFTYWDRKVVDALVARQFPPSGGFRNTQLDNIGELAAHGVELGVNTVALDRESVRISLFANAAYLNETVVDLGGAPPIKAEGTYPRIRNFIMEGYAPGSMFGAKLVGPCAARPSGASYLCLQDGQLPFDTNGDGVPDTEAEVLAYLGSPPALSLDDPRLNPLLVDEDGDGDFLDHYLGKPSPDWQGSFGATVEFLRDFEFSTLFEYRLGFHITDLTGAFRQAHGGIGRNIREAAEVEATILNPASTAEDRLEALKVWAYELKALAPFSGLNTMKKGDFMRWREASLTYYVPGGISRRLGLDNLSLTFSGRNLALFTGFDGIDPELSYNSRCNGGTSCSFAESINAYGFALPRRFTFSVRASF